MPVVLFFVLWMYIAYRRHQESVTAAESKKNIEAKSKDDEANYNEWVRCVVDRDLEAEIIRGIRDRKPEYIDEIKSTIEKYPDAANGKTADEIIEYNEFIYRGKYDAMHFGTRILMANRGKLMAEDALNGIFVGYCGNADFEKREYNRNLKAYITWINSMLRKHGVKQPLYLTSAHLTRPKPWATALQSSTSMGVAAWKPIISWTEFE